MRQLICEMCGSDNIIKQDGIFICQACKTKYTIEEAKKMMMGDEADTLDPAVSVPVQVAGANPSTLMLNNLLQLAQNSYNSKNYAQAENFCNQALTLDAENFIAWKIKGQAIDAQISASNDRIDEVRHCLLTAYKVLNEDDKKTHREEITKLLRGCLESEIAFAIDIFRNERPSEETGRNLTAAFVGCILFLEKSHIELGYTEEEASNYTFSVKNNYLSQINNICKNIWHNKVYYNYFRHGFTSEYRPTRDIMNEFLTESSALMALLEVMTEQFSDKTPVAIRVENYRLQKLIASTAVNAQSYKLMEYTTTNEYGAVINRRTQWENDTSLTDSARAFWNQIADRADVEITKANPNDRDRMIRQWQFEKKSISTTFVPHIGWIIATLFAGALAYITFTYLPDLLPRKYDFIFTIFGIFFVGMAVVALAFALIKGKSTYDDNMERLARLDRKIRQASGEEPTSGISNAQPAGPVSAVPRIVPADKWACKHCGTLNSKNYGQCKKCGTYKQ